MLQQGWLLLTQPLLQKHQRACQTHPHITLYSTNVVLPVAATSWLTTTAAAATATKRHKVSQRATTCAHPVVCPSVCLPACCVCLSACVSVMCCCAAGWHERLSARHQCTHVPPGLHVHRHDELMRRQAVQEGGAGCCSGSLLFIFQLLVLLLCDVVHQQALLLVCLQPHPQVPSDSV